MSKEIRTLFMPNNISMLALWLEKREQLWHTFDLRTYLSSWRLCVCVCLVQQHYHRNRQVSMGFRLRNAHNTNCILYLTWSIVNRDCAHSVVCAFYLNCDCISLVSHSVLLSCSLHFISHSIYLSGSLPCLDFWLDGMSEPIFIRSEVYVYSFISLIIIFQF